MVNLLLMMLFLLLCSIHSLNSYLLQCLLLVSSVLFGLSLSCLLVQLYFLSFLFIIKILYFCAFCDNRHNNWGYNKSKTSFYSKRFVIKALKNRSTTCITRNCRLPFFLFQVFVCSYYSPFCL